MQVAYVKFDGKPATVQLTSKAELGTITTPWTPSVYRGTGNETRVKMTVSIPDANREHMELIEEKVRDSLRAHSPRIDAIWHSSTKPGDKYPATLGSKIVLPGDKACRCVDADGKTVADAERVGGFGGDTDHHHQRGSSAKDDGWPDHGDDGPAGWRGAAEGSRACDFHLCMGRRGCWCGFFHVAATMIAHLDVPSMD